jgi:hypothetical protein
MTGEQERAEKKEAVLCIKTDNYLSIFFEILRKATKSLIQDSAFQAPNRTWDIYKTKKGYAITFSYRRPTKRYDHNVKSIKGNGYLCFSFPKYSPGETLKSVMRCGTSPVISSLSVIIFHTIKT